MILLTNWHTLMQRMRRLEARRRRLRTRRRRLRPRRRPLAMIDEIRYSLVRVRSLPSIRQDLVLLAQMLQSRIFPRRLLIYMTKNKQNTLKPKRLRHLSNTRTMTQRIFTDLIFFTPCLATPRFTTSRQSTDV